MSSDLEPSEEEGARELNGELAALARPFFAGAPGGASGGGGRSDRERPVRRVTRLLAVISSFGFRFDLGLFLFLGLGGASRPSL
jgi:hypothetical protein